MFERAICELQQLMSMPTVNIDALFELKQLLDLSSILMPNSEIGQAGGDTLSMAGEPHATVAAPGAIPTSLFEPRPHLATWERLPREAQEQSLQLLTKLLQQYWSSQVAQMPMTERSDE